MSSTSRVLANATALNATALNAAPGVALPAPVPSGGASALPVPVSDGGHGARAAEVWRGPDRGGALGAAHGGFMTPPEGWPAVSAAAVLAPIYERADRWIAVLVGLHAALALTLGPVNDTVPETLALTALGAGGYYASWLLRPGSFLTRVVAGLALQLFCALHIHQLSGLAEMHFFYFTSVTAMILYQDWRAMWPGIVAIIAQHTLFSAWHNAGVHPGDMRFFEPERVSAGKLAWHYSLALAQSAVASYAAISLRRTTLRGAAQRAALAAQAHALGAANAELEARAGALASANQRLQEQATELEAQSAQLQEQATELEAHNEALEGAAAALAAHAREREQLLTEATRRRQEAEQARREAEEANVVKAQFLASMSHELRTPLNAIGGYAELLTMGIRGAVTPEQHEDLGRIKRASQHLLALINDILQYARLEAGQLALDLRAVPLDATLAELDTLVAPQLAAKRLAYRYVPCDPALAVHADRERLVQVLLNLLTNALKYTPAGGRVDLWCERLPDGAVAVRVRDTGIGIPAALQGKIFDPFFQATRSFSTPEGGVGLGLAISRDLARAMDGDLTVESVPGVGSTFTVLLQPAPGTRHPAPGTA